MAFCHSCGHEYPAGPVCPYCGAQSTAMPPINVAGQLITRLSERLPVSATHIIVGLNVLVFVAMAVSGASPLNPTREQLLRWGANWGPLSLGSQPWRMLTSNYVHIGIIHIAFNMWCLWNLGQLAERVLGRLNYVVLYTFCGLAGSLASLWWHPMSVGAGASGAIFGLAGASIAVFYLGHLPIPKAAIQGTMRSLLTFVGYNLLFGLSPASTTLRTSVDLVAGLAMGAALSKHILVATEERRTWTRLTWIVMAVVLFAANGAIRRHYSQLAQLADPQVIATQQVQTARLALQQRRPDEAISQLQEVIEEQPNQAEPRYLLGEAYLMQRQPDPAIAAFQEALRLDPEFARGRGRTGYGIPRQGHEDRSRAGI